jgi:hypothetical protein
MVEPAAAAAKAAAALSELAKVVEGIMTARRNQQVLRLLDGEGRTQKPSNTVMYHGRAKKEQTTKNSIQDDVHSNTVFYAG